MRTKDDKQSDGGLVQRMRGGDRDAFTALVDRYRDMVYAAAPGQGGISGVVAVVWGEIQVFTNPRIELVPPAFRAEHHVLGETLPGEVRATATLQDGRV